AVRLGAILFLVLPAIPAINAQEVADTIKIRTRVVFMDALVKDKKTGVPIIDLNPENFELFDDGKPRKISYFTPEGQAGKPLALVLILDCRDDGAGRFLRKPEVIQAITEQLSRLAPGDEIGIMAMNISDDHERPDREKNDQRIWLTRFTNRPEEIAAALARVPSFVEKPEVVASEVQKSKKEEEQNQSSGSITVSSNSNDQKAAESTTKDPKKEIVETETIKGKNGAVVTRTTMKDGSVNLKRVNSKGNVTIELDDVYDMAAAVREATRTAEQERPNSRPSIIWLSDGIAPIFY